MAAYSVKRAKHATLVAATEDSITFTNDEPFRTVLIANRGTTDPIYFTIDGTAAVAGADETNVVSKETSKVVEGIPTKKVRLISAGAVAYSVEGY